MNMNHILLASLLTARAIFADFTASLTAEVKSDQENWVYSPLSVSACLSMAACGANGETFEEMRRTLDLPVEIGPCYEEKLGLLKHSPEHPTDFEIHIAQGLWVHHDLKMCASYQNAMQSYYDAKAECVAFNPCTTRAINDWISGQTHYKINDLIPLDALDEDTRLVLANALYFHGSWKSPFSESETALLPFTLGSGEKVSALQMSQTASFGYFADGTCQAVSLPFVHSRESKARPACLLILPKKGSSFDPASLPEIFSSLKPARIRLQVPKFKIENGIDMTEPLKGIGMKRALSPFADFSGIGGPEDLHISAVLHKAFFEFDEKGVEAAAATAAVICRTTAVAEPAFPISFIADRPFYFVLYDAASETVLFIGQVHNPKT